MRSYMDVINNLSDEQAGILIKGVAKYQFTGEPPEFDGILNAVWKGFEKLVESQVNGYKNGIETDNSNKVKGYTPNRGSNSTPKRPPVTPPKRTPNTKEERVKNKEENIYVDTKPFEENVRRINDDKNILTKTGVEEFINHWAEINQKTNRMRWQEQDFFEIPKRMSTWASNNYSGKAKPHKRGERGAEFNSQVF